MRQERSMATELTYVVGLRGGPLRRLEEAIIYISGVCETDAAFGKTRLNKILFEADFLSFETRGVPITGARYQRLQRGPAPKAMVHRLRDLCDRGELHVRETDYLGKVQHKPIALRRPDLSIFSAEDIAILDAAIRDSWGISGAEASHNSHRMEWKSRRNGDDIPYEAAWLSNEPPTEAEIERTKELAAEFAW
jgi:hypothetical protein